MKRLTNHFRILLIAVLSVFAMGVMAQTFTLSGEIRPRMEMRNGYKTLSPTESDAALFISQRSRLNFDYKQKMFKVGVSLQDIRVWGQAPQLNRVDGLSSIHQAWGEVLFTKKISLKAGRQEIIYDDHRIFGSVGWAQQARSHDAAILKYTAKKLKVHAGFAFNQTAETGFNTYYGIKNYKSFQYLWANYKMKAFSVSALYLNNGIESVDTNIFNPKGSVNDGLETNYSQTIGGRISAHPGGFGGNFAFYTQMGKDGAGRELSASYIGADLFYKITKDFKAVVGFEQLSGTNSVDKVGDYKNTSFTPFYGTNHKFNGHMDYFFVGNHGGSVGLQDIYATLSYKYKKINVGGTYHMFSTAAELTDATGTKMDANLGSEIDLSCGYTVNKMVNIKAGYSLLLAKESMQTLKIKDGGDMDSANSWAWLMLTFKPTFLKHNQK